MKSFIASALLFAAVLAPVEANATVVTVSGFSGPWDQTISGNSAYGVGDNLAPTTVNVTAGSTVIVQYVSGTTGAFAGVPPSYDATGEGGSLFGSGPGLTGIGSSGNYFPSYYINGTATSGPDIYLGALIGVFLNSSGDVIGTPFAPGDALDRLLVPTGATQLALGINDDIFSDNSGALSVNVTGVPEPATWAMFLLGFGAIGWSLRSSRRLAATA